MAGTGRNLRFGAGRGLHVFESDVIAGALETVRSLWAGKALGSSASSAICHGFSISKGTEDEAMGRNLARELRWWP